MSDGSPTATGALTSVWALVGDLSEDDDGSLAICPVQNGHVHPAIAMMQPTDDGLWIVIYMGTQIATEPSVIEARDAFVDILHARMSGRWN